jgi:uncharacterized NAD(P)/FAD-binding protein YdhS
MKSFRVNDYKTISMADDLYEDFMVWLAHECDGAKPSEGLFNEFIYLEETYSKSLRKRVMKEISKNEKRNLSRKS